MVATFQPSSAQKQQKYHLTQEKQSCSRCFRDTWPQTLFLVTPHYHPLAESQVKEVHGTGPVSCQYGMRWWWSPQLLVEVPHKSPGSEYQHQYPAPSFHLPSPVEQNDWPSRILGWRFPGPLCWMTTLSRLGSWLAMTLMLHDHSKTLCSPPSGLHCCPGWDTQSVSVDVEHWLLPESAKAPLAWSLWLMPWPPVHMLASSLCVWNPLTGGRMTQTLHHQFKCPSQHSLETSTFAC